MKRLLFILLLLPLFAFPQAEKPYRSIIIDSVKALNGGRIDVKDTLLLDSLAVYNSDLSSQYTSRSLVDSAFVGIAVSGGGANTIYNADDNLAGNRVVTMGANSLTFSGNLTTFKGIDATSANDALLVTDNVNTKLLIVENAGDVGIGLANPTAQLHINTSNSFASQLLLESSNTTGTGLTVKNTSTGGNTWTIISNGSSNMGGAGHLQFFNVSTSKTPFFFHKDGMLGIDRAFSGFVPTRLLELKTNEDDDGLSLFLDGSGFQAFLLTSPIGGYLQLRAFDGTTVIVSLNDDNNTHDFLNTGNTRNFGIGLTLPTAKVHVRDDVASTVAIMQLHNDRNAVSSNSLLTFSLDNSANAEIVYACVSAEIRDNTDGSEDGDFKFKTILAGSLTEKMTLFSTGNLGIDDSLSVGKNHPDIGFVADFFGHIKVDSTISTPNKGELLGVAATTFAVETNVMTITGDGGGNTVATITGGKDGMLLTLIFTDGNVTITDDNSHASDTIDLSAAFTSSDDTTLQIVFDGTSWYEVSRSTN